MTRSKPKRWRSLKSGREPSAPCSPAAPKNTSSAYINWGGSGSSEGFSAPMASEALEALRQVGQRATVGVSSPEVKESPQSRQRQRAAVVEEEDGSQSLKRERG